MDKKDLSHKVATTRTSIITKIAKAAAWIVGALVVIILLVLGSVSLIFSPERLTRMANDLAAPYIKGDLTIDNVELTIWSTFPHTRLDIDRVTLCSELPTEMFPEDADSLLSIDHIHSGINLAALIVGRISLTDTEIRGLMINAVALNDSTSNYDIFATADTTDNETAEESTLSLPDISISRFAVNDSRSIRYRLLSDSIDVTLNLKPTALAENQSPIYDFASSLHLDAKVSPDIDISQLALATDGTITWSSDAPSEIALDGFTLSLNTIEMTMSTALDMSTSTVIKRLSLNMPPTALTSIIDAIPQCFASTIPVIEAENKVLMSVALSKPYDVSTDTLPSLTASFKLHPGSLSIREYDLNLDNITADISAVIEGNDMESSAITINDFKIKGMGTQAQLIGSVTHLTDDPYIKGRFSGKVDFDNLAKGISEMIPGEVKGLLNADSEFKFLLSNIHPKRFHNVKVSGNLGLENFYYTAPDSLAIAIYANKADFKLGTSESFSFQGQHRVDSLLTATLAIDTMSVCYDGMNVAMSGLKAGIGCLNKANSSDTTQVNPIGGSFRFKRFNFTGADSIMLRMTDVTASAAIKRFNGNNKVPQVDTRFKASRIGYRDNANRVSLRESSFDITAHLKPRPERKTNTPLRPSRPGINPIKATNVETVDLELDRSTRQFIRRLDLKGSLKAQSGRLFSPYFPLRNSIRDVDVAFTTDSVTFNDIVYTAGKSDFNLSGSVSNISRFATGRPGAVLKLNFSSTSNLIDINELSYAIFAGAAFAQESDSLASSLSAIEDENKLEEAVTQSASDEKTALLIPVNIDANLNVKAHAIDYAEFRMTDFNGEVLLHDGAVNLSDLSANTTAGSAHLTALYSAPTKRDMQFGFGMQLKDVDLKEAIGLIPKVDSLMPLIKSFEGRVNANVAATTDLDSVMNFVTPTLNAAIRLEGDSLVLLDPETFKTVSKWMLFKQKDRNMIDHMSVELIVKNSILELFPFVFDIDRYRIGVMGHNDLDFNLNYHISVLKSPIPFKFGINIGGTTDNMKIRLGRAKYKEGMSAQSVAIVDTTRINLLNQIQNVFRHGARTQKLRHINIDHRNLGSETELATDTLSHADSLEFIRQGLLPPPDTTSLQPSIINPIDNVDK